MSAIECKADMTDLHRTCLVMTQSGHDRLGVCLRSIQRQTDSDRYVSLTDERG